MKSNYLWQKKILCSSLPQGPDISARNLLLSRCPAWSGFWTPLHGHSPFRCSHPSSEGRMWFIEDALHHVLPSTPWITRSPWVSVALGHLLPPQPYLLPPGRDPNSSDGSNRLDLPQHRLLFITEWMAGTSYSSQNQNFKKQKSKLKLNFKKVKISKANA